MEILRKELNHQIKEIIQEIPNEYSFESSTTKDNVSQIGKSYDENIFQSDSKKHSDFQNYENNNQSKMKKIFTLYQDQSQTKNININNKVQTDDVEENDKLKNCEEEESLEEKKKKILKDMKIKEERRIKQKALYEEELRKKEEYRREEKQRVLQLTGYKECPKKEIKTKDKSKSVKRVSEHSAENQDATSEKNMQVINEPEEVRSSIRQSRKSEPKVNIELVQRLSKIKSNQDEDNKEIIIPPEEPHKTDSNLNIQDEPKNETSNLETKRESEKITKEVKKKPEKRVPNYQQKRNLNKTPKFEKSLKSKPLENSRNIRSKNKTPNKTNQKSGNVKKTEIPHKEVVIEEPEETVLEAVDEDDQINNTTEKKSINNKNAPACCKTEVKTKKMELEKERPLEENEQTERKDLGDTK